MLAKGFFLAGGDVSDLNVWHEQIRIEHHWAGKDMRLGHACPNMDGSKRLQRNFSIVWTYHAGSGRAGDDVIFVGIDFATEKLRLVVLNQVAEGALFSFGLNENAVSVVHERMRLFR